MGNDNVATNIAIVHIQESNHFFTHFLSPNGYNALALKNKIKKVSGKSVTV